MVVGISHRLASQHTLVHLKIKRGRGACMKTLKSYEYGVGYTPTLSFRAAAPTLSFQAAARPSPHRRALAHRRAVDCESLFLSFNNLHELAQRPRVTQHGSVAHFRPIHKLRALNGGVRFPPVPAAGECGSGGTAIVSSKAVTLIDTALLDTAPGAVRCAAAAAVHRVTPVPNIIMTPIDVVPVEPIGGISRGYRGIRGERRVGEQKPSEGLGGDDRVPARQPDDYWAPDVVRPHDVLRSGNWACIYDGKARGQGKGRVKPSGAG